MATTLRTSLGIALGVLLLVGCAKGSRIPSSVNDGLLGSLLDAGSSGTAQDAGQHAKDAGSFGTGGGAGMTTTPPVDRDAGNGDAFGPNDASSAQDSASADACSNGVKDGIEQGVDCGGLCDPCVTPDAGSCTPVSCGAMECGQKPNGCGSTLTCSYQCPSGNTCTANKCVAPPPPPPTCSINTCTNTCPALQSKCCTSANKCGCALLGFLGCT